MTRIRLILFHPALWSAAAALVVYAVTLRGSFVYDDKAFILHDARLANPRSIQWSQFLLADYSNNITPDRLYRPLTSLSYAAQMWLHGPWPLPFHIVNWLLHAAASALVAGLTCRLTRGNSRAALAAGLLFAVHPVHVEAVANIVGRAELMAGVASVGAVVLFLRRPLSVGRALAIVGCFVLALGSKEQGILLPIVLLVAEFAVVRRSASPLLEHGDGERIDRSIVASRAKSFAARLAAGRTYLRDPRLRGAVTLVVLICLTLSSYIVWRERVAKFWWDRSFMGPVQNPMMTLHGLSRQGGAVVILGHAAAVMIFPAHLIPDYRGSVILLPARAGDSYLWLGALAVIIWIVGVVIAIRARSAAGLFGLLAAAVYWALVANVFSIIGTVFGERLLYLPSAMLLVAGGAALARLPRRVFAVVLTALVFAGGWRTVAYARLWNDPPRLYDVARAQEPGAFGLHLLAGEEKSQAGDIAGARLAYAAARDAAPDYFWPWLQSAKFELAQGNLDAARGYYDRACRLDLAAGMTDVGQSIDAAVARAATRPAGP